MKSAFLFLVICAAAHADDQPLIWRVTVNGARAISESEIKQSISTTESSHIFRFWPFRVDRFFDPIEFQTDQKRIEHLYRRKGYFKAKVARTSVESCSSAVRVCVTFFLSEGEPTRIESVKARGVGEEFVMKPGEIFDHDRYLAQKKAALADLRAKGHPFAAVKGEARYDPERNTIALEFLATSGELANIGEIHFDGLDQIRHEDVAARLPIKTGERYDPQRLEDSETLLASLDVFRSIEIELKPRQDQKNIVDVIFHVREKQLRTLQGGGGVRIENSRHEVRLLGEWKHRNFYRHLRTFEVRGEPKYAVLPSIFRPEESGLLGSFQMSMQEPAFLSPWQDLNVSTGFDANVEQGYRWYGPRISTDLSRMITRQLSVSFGYAFRYFTFYHLNLGATPDTALVPQALLFRRNYRLGFLNQQATWDRRDNLIEPRRGYWMRMRIEESVPMLGSAFTYARFLPEIRGYTPLHERATVSGRVLYGRLAPLFGSDSPITERFYEGGSNGHRGFAYHRLSPQVLGAGGRSVPVGGNVEFLASVEPRVRLFTLGEYWMIGALFLDAGDVVESEGRLDFKNLHYALGAGLRYETVVGVLRADIGFRLNRLSEQTRGQPNPDPGSRYAVHISFGEAF